MASARLQSDLLHVLAGRRKKALLLNLAQPPHAGIAVPMKLLGVGKTAFNRFFTALVDLLSPIIIPMFIHPVFVILPDVPRNHLDVVGALSALIK